MSTDTRTHNSSNMVAEQRSSAVSSIIHTIVPLVMEEIIEVVRRISHESIQQRIVEEIVDVPEADQGHPTFERQPSVSRADTSRTGAGVVSQSELSAYESNLADEADATWTKMFETQQLPPACTMAAVTTGVNLDITGLAKPQLSTTVVEASAHQCTTRSFRNRSLQVRRPRTSWKPQLCS